MYSSHKFQQVSRTDIMTQENIAIWDKLSMSISVVDGAGVCVYMNRFQREIDGFTDIEVVGKHFTELYLPNDMLRLPTLECLRLGEPILNKSYVYRTVNNQFGNVIVDFLPLFSHGRKDGVIIFGMDIVSHRPAPGMFSSGEDTRYTFDSIIGQSPAILDAISDARAAARNSANVIIWGESGTGKELFAQAIHASSSRRNSPFVPVNCAAIPENLLEGLLFGTVKGAYTDAADAPGLFEKANGGTLLLDELNSMPLGLQAKLLRAIQEKKIRRVGSQTEKAVDVRVIGVLNQAPLSAVEEGMLRLDLYYRLAVVGVSVPPLRERLEDIPLIVSSFLKKSSPEIRVSESVLKMFLEWHWPGNIRELLHVVEGSLAMLGNRTVIDSDCLPRQFFEASRGRQGKASQADQTFVPEISGIDDYRNVKRNSVIPLREQLNAFEAQCIRNVLRVTGGNVAKAARIMDLTGPGLRYKIKQLGIGEDDF